MRTVLRRTLPVLAILLLVPTWSPAETTAETYKTTCAMCHGPAGKGDTALGQNLHAKDLTSDEVQKKTNEELNTIIVKGKENMPGFEGRLTQAQINGLVKFIRTLKK
ncbi:MAG TPA: cytochrome c [Terriglobales bacterium]|jgi:mono/diheme cytochrome c family protein|nr:cytochrome c [Terriglobales bacterium]